MAKRKKQRAIILPPLPEYVDEYDPNVTLVEEHDEEGIQRYIPSSRHGAKGMAKGALNVVPSLDGNILTLSVDLSVEYGIPEFRKNIRIASTLGRRPVLSPKHPYTFYMLAVYRFPQEGDQVKVLKK